LKIRVRKFNRLDNPAPEKENIIFSDSFLYEKNCFVPLCMGLASKLAKCANITRKNNSQKIQYGYKKTQNLILIPNLKKLQKSFKKE
jgi:hypothetical protein